MILIFHNRNQTHWIVLGMMIWPCLCHANVRHSLFSRMWHADCTNTNWNIQQSSPLKMSTIQLIIRVFLFTQITSRTGTGNSGRISEWIHFNSKFPSAWSELVVSSRRRRLSGRNVSLTLYLLEQIGMLLNLQSADVQMVENYDAAKGCFVFFFGVFICKTKFLTIHS